MMADGDDGYPREACRLVLEALGTTAELLRKGELRPSAPYAGARSPDGREGQFHVSGRELLEGFRRHVRERYGNLALLVLERWGIRSCEDVGEIVFRMVESGELSRREQDTREEFEGGFDFAEAFGADTTVERSD